MSLYLPRDFEQSDLGQLDRLAAEHPFASLITVRDGTPCVSHVPLLYRRDGARILLRGHLAHPNPQAGRGGEALAILRGPDAYVSPAWYADKASEARVPTWNYIVAHLSGTLAWFEDEPSLAAVVAELAGVHEARAGSDWRFDLDNPAERVQLRGIVGFELMVQRVEFKAKLSQNHPLDNRLAVIARLAASPRAADRAVAEWMHATLPAIAGEA